MTDDWIASNSITFSLNGVTKDWLAGTTLILTNVSPVTILSTCNPVILTVSPLKEPTLSTITSCVKFEKVDQRQMPDGAKAKARKN